METQSIERVFLSEEMQDNTGGKIPFPSGLELTEGPIRPLLRLITLHSLSTLLLLLLLCMETKGCRRTQYECSVDDSVCVYLLSLLY